MKNTTFDLLEHGSGHNRQRTGTLCTFVLSLTLNITLSLCLLKVRINVPIGTYNRGLLLNFSIFRMGVK